jgi:dihydrodipicolinate synthase/N-acetylneuraminate lyase
MPTHDDWSQSVIAVPPLARNADRTLSPSENQRMIRHLEQGGVTTLLYGGNANLYHVGLGDYAALLSLLRESVSPGTRVIPSVGPAFGTMLEQAALLREHPFSTAMILPQREITTPAGVASAVRLFVEALGRPAVLYVKFPDWIDAPTVGQLARDGLISLIKYAIVREDPAEDTYLRELVESVDGVPIVSGIGEQPALIHMRQFGLAGYTSGCVCVAPALSMRMLRAIVSGDWDQADRVRQVFQPLEDLRNEISPIRVLHAAVALAGIARTGPLIPLLSDLEDRYVPQVAQAARELLATERTSR